MFDRILVPVEFSESDKKSIFQAAQMTHDRSIVTLIHVIRKIDHLDEKEDHEFYDRLEKMAADKMGELIVHAKSYGLTTHAELFYGKKVAGILGHAREHDINLIVMNSTAVDWTEPLRGMDSTSHSVAMLSQCPVFLLKSGGD